MSLRAIPGTDKPIRLYVAFLRPFYRRSLSGVHSGRKFLLYGQVLRQKAVTSPFAAAAHTLPKAAQAILALPGVQSLEREPDGWCCHLMPGWTTDALSGGGTIVDSNLRTIRDHVKGAYVVPVTEPELPAFIASAPTLAHTLAAEYLAAPAATPTDRELEMLRGWIRAEFQRIPVMVRFEGADIPLPEMLQRWEHSGVLFISVESISHPFLTDIENALFRAVHDWHHIVVNADSTLNGEILAFEHACSTAPSEIWWMLRSEIVLQAAACIATGEFQPQKLVR